MRTRGGAERLFRRGLLLFPLLVGCGTNGPPTKVAPEPGRSENVSAITNPFPFDNGFDPHERGRDMRNCALDEKGIECRPETFGKRPRPPLAPVSPPLSPVPRQPFPGLPNPGHPNPDAGSPDPGSTDGGNPDPGDLDAGTPDPGDLDAGNPDADTSDSGNPDPGDGDGGTSDPGDAGVGNPDSGTSDPNEPDAGEETPASARTLVLYDSTGPYGWLGELYAILAGNLASHFGDWTAKPVVEYQAGEMRRHEAVIYVGSTYEEPLPTAFLDDVLTGQTPVVWMYNNIWQLSSHAPDFVGRYGFMPNGYDFETIPEVVYKGVSLSRYEGQGSGVMAYGTVDESIAQTVATAVRWDNVRFPWALRAKNLTYVGEIPFSYITANDRYLVFADMLFDVLAPDTPERHRALLRLEDVSPAEDPATLRAIADYLASKRIPFSVAVIPVYTDPRGVYNEGVPVTMRLSETPEMVATLQYMVSKGARIVMHGYTHQYSNIDNPYNGVSADDTEFYLMHVDELDYVIYDGPVPDDSPSWVNARIQAGLDELARAGLGRPWMFEYPHYAGSHLDSVTIRQHFDVAYHRGLYFGGTLRGGQPNYQRIIGQFFPYVVRDIYGWKVLPENLGNYEPVAMNHHPERLVGDIVHTALVNRVVRDGMASVFYHPYYGLPKLREIVEGILGAGYTFVAPEDL